ncbi:MAG TPA: 50S ribosomal protein L5, partial [Candidatus Binatia bacterium]
MVRLKQKYAEQVVSAMKSEFGYKNSMQVPKLEKITINVGLGEATQNIKALDSTVAEIT